MCVKISGKNCDPFGWDESLKNINKAPKICSNSLQAFYFSAFCVACADKRQALDFRWNC